MDGMSSFADVRDRFESGPFRVGWHKAYQIACDAGRSELITVTGLPSDLAQRLLLCPACDLNAAIDAAADVLPADADVCVMPHAGATCPVLEGADDRQRVPGRADSGGVNGSAGAHSQAETT